jgi:hypothetical protein
VSLDCCRCFEGNADALWVVLYQKHLLGSSIESEQSAVFPTIPPLRAYIRGLSPTKFKLRLERSFFIIYCVRNLLYKL